MPSTLKLVQKNGEKSSRLTVDQAGVLAVNKVDQNDQSVQGDSEHLLRVAGRVTFDAASSRTGSIGPSGVAFVEDGSSGSAVSCSATPHALTFLAPAKTGSIGPSGVAFVEDDSSGSVVSCSATPHALTFSGPSNSGEMTANKAYFSDYTNFAAMTIESNQLLCTDHTHLDGVSIGFEPSSYKIDMRSMLAEDGGTPGHPVKLHVRGTVMDDQLRGSSVPSISWDSSGTLTSEQTADLYGTLGYDTSGGHVPGGKLPLDMESVTMSALVDMIAKLQERVRVLEGFHTFT